MPSTIFLTFWVVTVSLFLKTSPHNQDSIVERKMQGRELPCKKKKGKNQSNNENMKMFKRKKIIC